MMTAVLDALKARLARAAAQTADKVREATADVAALHRAGTTLRGAARRALWLTGLQEVSAGTMDAPPSELLPSVDDDPMRWVRILRDPPRRGALAHVERGLGTTTCSESSREVHGAAAQLNYRARVTYTGDRVIIELPTHSPVQAARRPSLVMSSATASTPPPAPRGPRGGSTLPEHMQGTTPLAGIALPKPGPDDKPTRIKMSKDKQELSFEGEMPVEKIVTYLQGLSQGLSEGTVPVESGLDKVVLQAAPTMKMKIKAKVKKRDNALRIELEWSTPEGVGLRIGANGDD